MTKVLEQMKIVCNNRRARHDYQITDAWEAGICLEGLEVKALRYSKISINEAYISVRNNEVFLIGCNINPDKVPSWHKYDPQRRRKLLLKKTQIKKLHDANKSGYTIVPLKVYFNSKGLAKIEIAVGKGKKLHDKRKTLRDRDNKRYGF